MKNIYLSKGYFAIVDDEDFDLVNQYKWYYNLGRRCKTGRASTRLKDKNNKFGTSHIFMHRLIMSAPKGMQVDHINGNGLDNRKSNLRICTQSENNKNMFLSSKNKSGYKGVSWHKYANKWRATAKDKYKQVHLGLFENKIDAARAYDDYVVKNYGEFARTNL